MNRIARHLHHGNDDSSPRRANQEGPPAEDPVVRQYRYLLRTAPADALEAAHVEALNALEPPDRAVVLSTVQTVLVAGLRLGPNDTAALAHLISTGERRVPGALLTSYPDVVRNKLGANVIHSEAAFGLFSGYAGWDGADPPRNQDTDDSPYAEQWHEGQDTPAKYRGLAAAPPTPKASSATSHVRRRGNDGTQDVTFDFCAANNAARARRDGCRQVRGLDVPRPWRTQPRSSFGRLRRNWCLCRSESFSHTP